MRKTNCGLSIINILSTVRSNKPDKDGSVIGQAAPTRMGTNTDVA